MNAPCDALTLLMWGAGAVALLVVAGWAHLRFWTARLTQPMVYASEERVATPDGSAFELRRIPTDPAATPATELPPVLLVHGVAINHRNLDTHPDWSLARHLSRQGREVWLLTLRTGLPDLSRAQRRRSNFLSMVRYDVPLAITQVLERTGATHLDYVGFSMGGMLMYASIGHTVPQTSVRRVAFIGSPGLGKRLSLVGLDRLLPPSWIPAVPLRFSMRMLAFAAGWSRHDSLAVNLANAAPGLAALSAVDAIRDIPAAVAADFVRWSRAGGPIDVGGTPLFDGLQDVRVPALFVAGAGDQLAPPSSVGAAADAWGRAVGTEKHLLVVGLQHGHRADYGHGDLAIGLHAPAEVYAPVAAFLAEPTAASALQVTVSADSFARSEPN
ncbi:MAG: alpha/beta fold hydrolase [Myxococcota bacterium]